VSSIPEIVRSWAENPSISFFADKMIQGHPGPEVFFRTFLYSRIKEPVLGPPFHEELFNLLVTSSRIVIAAPRAHSKSTICSFAYPLWKAINEPRSEIIIVSRTAQLAEKWLGAMATEVESNPKILGLYGNLKSGPWNRHQLTFKNESKIYAKGKNFQIRGFRPGLVVLDDLEDDESVRSETQRADLDQWLHSALINVLDAGVSNQLVMIGNYIGPSCLLKRKIDEIGRGEQPNWQARVFSAVQGDGKALWPSKWSMPRLEERRTEIGTRRFASEFLNDPMPEGVTLIREAWIKYFTEVDVPLNIFMTVDPADSIKKSADYSVVMVGGTDSENNLYVLEYQRGHFTPKKFYDVIFAMHRRWEPMSFAMEKQVFKNHLRAAFRNEQKERNYFFPVRELAPVADKVTRANPMIGRMESGKVFIKQEHRDLFTEMIEFPYGDHDDTVDCLSYLNQIAFEHSTIKPKRRIPSGSFYDFLQKEAISHKMRDTIFNAW